MRVYDYIKKYGMKKVFLKCIRRMYVFINPMFVKNCPFPINNNKIVISNFNGKGYGGDPKYICDELLKIRKYEIVWAVSDTHHNNEIPNEIRTVRIFSARYYYDMATAKLWIDNVRKTKEISKRPGQYYLQTWHGFIPLKQVEKDVEDKLSSNYVSSAIHDSDMIDAFLSSCATRSELIRRAFWYNGTILEIGCPRNDIFFKHNRKKNDLFDKLKISTDKGVLVYAPTFRKSESVEAYNIDFRKLKHAIENKYHKEFEIVLRLHPNLQECNIKEQFGSDIIDGSVIQDGQWLFSNADILISDYSDSLFETALSNTPVFIYASDLESYYKERDFYINLFELPFSVSRDTDELIQRINDFDKDSYLQKLNDFWKTQVLYENGNASERAASWVMQKMDS